MFLNFYPDPWGNDWSNLTIICSNGLVQPLYSFYIDIFGSHIKRNITSQNHVFFRDVATRFCTVHRRVQGFLAQGWHTVWLYKNYQERKCHFETFLGSAPLVLWGDKRRATISIDQFAWKNWMAHPQKPFGETEARRAPLFVEEDENSEFIESCHSLNHHLDVLWRGHEDLDWF